LRGKRAFNIEVAVVVPIVCFKSYVSAPVQKILYVEVSDKSVVVKRFVSVAEIAVKQQSVVEQVA